MGYFELKRYIRKLQSEGYDATRYVVDLHGKMAFPLVSIILAVIGISFSLRSERSGGIAQGIGAGLVIGFSYWLVYAFGMSLGSPAPFPPSCRLVCQHPLRRRFRFSADRVRPEDLAYGRLGIVS